MSALAKIHVGRQALGLDDDTYRDLLSRVTGKRSAKDLTVFECGRVLEEMKRLGFKAEAKKPAKGAVIMDGPYGRKLQALWITGYNLGVVKDRTDRACLAFIEHQTGISHTRFLHDQADAKKAIEALKKWFSREAGVVWPGSAAAPHATQRAVIAAQLRLLGLPAASAANIYDLNGYVADLGGQVRRLAK